MNIQFTLAARYLWGRKLRMLLTTLAIIFGALVIFGMNILLPTMLSAFQSGLLNASGQVDVLVTHKTGETFSPSVIKRIESIRGVYAVSGSLERTINIPANFYRAGNVGAVTLIGIEPKAAQQIREYTIAQGRFLQNNDTNVAVITAALANTLKLRVGDELALPTVQGAVKLKIIGIRQTQTLPGNEPVWVTLNEAQKLLNIPNRINTLEVKLDTTAAAQRDAITNAIAETLGQDFQLGGLASGSELLASFQNAQQTFNGLGFLALFMGGFIIFNTFRTIVAERRHDIGMLRAIGASGIYPIAYSFPFTGALVAVAAGLIFGVLAALIPARQAARRDIIHALRYE